MSEEPAVEESPQVTERVEAVEKESEDDLQPESTPTAEPVENQEPAGTSKPAEEPQPEDTTPPETPPKEETKQSLPSNVTITFSGRKRPPFKYDPAKLTLRFLFANKDGLTVTIDCKPADTVGEVKGALLSVWPEGLPNCTGGDRLRLVCMGKGILMPDSRSLEDCQVPVFKTHPTPVNVSVRPEASSANSEKQPSSGGSRRSGSARNHAMGVGSGAAVDQGCACTIL